MNNYCKNLKKRKNKPYCKLLNKEITFSQCQECVNKEYRTKINKNSFYKSNNSADTLQCSVKSADTLQCSVKMQYKSKKMAKLERNRRSVFTSADRCFVCNSTYQLTWNEIYRGRNRSNSMEDGFCLRMCLNCHGEYQNDTNFNNFWHREAQLYFEKHYGTKEDFINRYRRNYLE